MESKFHNNIPPNTISTLLEKTLGLQRKLSSTLSQKGSCCIEVIGLTHPSQKPSTLELYTLLGIRSKSHQTPSPL